AEHDENRFRLITLKTRLHVTLLALRREPNYHDAVTTSFWKAMAGASLLLLLDDIASVLDDVALMTKAASKKTAGVLGDDIALNAQQVSGVVAKRELPVVWAVAKGSFVNKLIIVPAALAISAFVPQAITPLLMLGGIYLCYEGVEKVVHSLLHPQDKAHLVAPGSPPPADISKALDTSGHTPE